MKGANLVIKRVCDVLGSGLCILIFSPIFVIAAILIKATMPGPVFFMQTRVGKGNQPFKVYKFRTMRVDQIAEATHDFSKDEARITPLGRILRRTKIDELPQLLNVLNGDMSLVGPRPTVGEQVEGYTARQRQRLSVRPGMTGLAQVNGNTSLSWEQRIEYDLEYVQNFTVLLDLKILLRTISVVILGEQRFRRERPAQKREVIR